MDCARLMFLRGIQQAVDAQIAFRRGRWADMLCLIGHPNVQRGAVGIRKNRNAGDVHLTQRANDAHRDLTPVGDQYFSEFGKQALFHVGKTAP